MTTARISRLGVQIKKHEGVSFSDGDAFIAIGKAFREHFKREDVIDNKIRDQFEGAMNDAPKQTIYEKSMIESIMWKAAEMKFEAKRLPGTVNDSVEKFVNWKAKNGIAWGWTIARLDAPAKKTFSRLWCKNTYEIANGSRGENGDLPFGVWEVRACDASRNEELRKRSLG